MAASEARLLPLYRSEKSFPYALIMPPEFGFWQARLWEVSMRIAVKCLYFVLAVLFCQSLPTSEAAAAECGDIYPGARVGPPPEWTFWADGSACFVRWEVDSPSREEELLEQCRNTPGARFVSFEPAKNGGQSICIFKLLDVQAAEAAESTTASDPKSDAATVAPKRSPTEKQNSEKVLEEIDAMVRGRNEECLAKERAADPLGAGQCWKIGAEVVREFIEVHPIPGKGLKQKLVELQATWIARAEQLEGTTALQKNAAIQIEPSSTEEVQEPEQAKPVASAKEKRSAGSVPRHTGPDPNRLSATAACSSAMLGSKKKCVSAPKPKGGNLYELRLNADCKTGSIAAIGATDDTGKCVRKVVSLSTGEEQLIESHAEPIVVDAIAYEPDYVQCYSRRHVNISCDGKVDYEGAQSASKSTEPPKHAAQNRTKKQARRLKGTKTKAVAAKEQPVKIGKVRKNETALKVTTNYTRQPDSEQNARKRPVTKVTTNYTRKPELEHKAKKQPSVSEQNKPSFQCLLFSKLC